MSAITNLNKVEHHPVKTVNTVDTKRVTSLDGKNLPLDTQFGKVVCAILEIVFAILCPPYGLYKIYQLLTRAEKEIPQTVIIVHKKNFLTKACNAIGDNPIPSTLLATGLAAAATALFWLKQDAPPPPPPPSFWDNLPSWDSGLTTGIAVVGVTTLLFLAAWKSGCIKGIKAKVRTETETEPVNTTYKQLD